MNSEEKALAFIALWERIQVVILSDKEDQFQWKRGPSMVYSARSAYQFRFMSRIPQPHLQIVWSLKTEGKIKFFLSLLLRNRLWTADRLQARHWDHNDNCMWQILQYLILLFI